MLTQEEYNQLAPKVQAYQNAIAKYLKEQGRTWHTREEIVEAGLEAISNEQTSLIEQFEFYRDKPERYFAYLSDDYRAVTTWTGDKLLTIRLTNVARSNFGDKRYYFSGETSDGVKYWGVGYGGAGCYCRIYKRKGQ